MNQIHPLQIVEVALTLGYNEQDLYPLSLQQLEHQSFMITKNMTLKQKQFYLQKKSAINEARRLKIIKQVYQHSQLLQNQLNNYRNYNPKVKEIIQLHEKSIQKSLKYNQVRSRASSRSQSKNNSNHKFNSINLGRSSPISSNRSSLSKTSQTSRNVNSQASNRSNRTSSSANSLSRSKLNSVREKQKEQLQIKKRMLQQKQRQNEMKFLKAEENALNKSRRVKIRSEISQKIVKENKVQMDAIRNMGTKEHLQSLKFSIAKHNHEREKKLESISNSQRKDVELYLVSNTNKKIQRSRDYMKRYRYEEKQRNSLDWLSEYNIAKLRNIQLMQREKEVKGKLADERRSFKEQEEKKFREQVMVLEQRRISDAQKRRQQQLTRRKLTGISQQVRREIVGKNKKSIESSESMRKQLITKHYNEKVQELSYIDHLKESLKRRQISFANSSDKTYLNLAEKSKGPRHSITSKNYRQPYFSTIMY